MIRGTRHGWRKWLRRTLMSMLVFVLAVLVAAGGYVGYAAIRHAQTITLPAPTGRYQVGRATFDWTDHHRTDPLATQPGIPRELSVWLWYPATGRTSSPPAPYAPGAWHGLHFPGVPGLGETSLDAIHTHSHVDAPVAAGRFPIVVLEPGMGLAAPQFTTIAENVASHGYLVAGVTPTYSANLTVVHGHAVASTAAGNPSTFTTAAGNRLVKTWAADARFVSARVVQLDHYGRFADHIDTARTAYIGHSFGGASSIQACTTDRHCAGAVDLDGTPFGDVVSRGLDKPLMIIASGDSCVTGTCHPAGATERHIRRSARSLLAASTGPTWCYGIKGTQHFNFTDYAAYYLAAPVRSLVPLGRVDGDRGLMITGSYVTAFLDHIVRDKARPLLTDRSDRYPEVRTQRSPS
ncbi:MAG: hypothetical protein ACRDP4_12395 [Nocardioidaceae bacterium]